MTDFRPPIVTTGNKRELAAFFGVSAQAIDGWISRGCPAVERASPGKAWLFDFREVAKWRYSQGREAAAVPTDTDPESLPPRDRLDFYRAARERTRHHEELRQLVPAIEFETALAEAFKLLAVTLESLPDVLERDAGISGAAVERCQAVIDRLREDLYQRMVAPR